MLDGDVLVPEPACLLLGGVQEAGQPLGDVDLARVRTWSADPGPPAQLGLQGLSQPVRISPGLAEQPGDDALGLIQQRDEQMLDVDLGVAEAERLRLRVVQCFL